MKRMKPNKITIVVSEQADTKNSVEETWQLLNITFRLENLCKEPHFVK